MSWLVCHNPEIDWKTGEVKMMRCPDECGKQWKMKQTKLEWQKEKEKEQKKEKMQKERRKEFRKPMIEEEMDNISFTNQ